MSTTTAALPVALALWRRSLNEVLRVRGALLPATIAPVVFLLGMSGQFGRLTGLDAFPTDSYLSWVVPLSCLQGAGFAGAANRLLGVQSASVESMAAATDEPPNRATWLAKSARSVRFTAHVIGSK